MEDSKRDFINDPDQRSQTRSYPTNYKTGFNPDRQNGDYPLGSFPEDPYGYVDHQVSLHRGKGPKNYRRSDERIMDDVCERLTDDAKVDASGIEVGVLASEVTLKGTVQSPNELRIAEEIAEKVAGVINVQNHLCIGSPGHVK